MQEKNKQKGKTGKPHKQRKNRAQKDSVVSSTHFSFC